MGVLKLFELASRMDKVGVAVTRVGLIVVLLWIGGLKAFRYEADGIVPFVANSPTMSFFYADPGNYKAHKNPEGALVPANRAWHEANRTYPFAYGLGAVIVLYGLLLCLHPWLPQVAAVGSFLVFVMSFVTLSFLVTTPGVLGSAAGRCPARVPVPERGRAAGRQGRHHDGGGPGDDGRLGEGVPAEAGILALAVERRLWRGQADHHRHATSGAGRR